MSDVPFQGPNHGFVPDETPLSNASPAEKTKNPYGSPKVWIWGVSVFLVLLFAAGGLLMNYTSRGEHVLSSCLVNKKGFENRDRHQERGYILATENCGTLLIRDSPLARAGDKKVLYDSIEVGKTYTFKVIGREFFREYPKILEVTEAR